MRSKYPLLAAVLLAVLLAGCGANTNKNGATDAPITFPPTSSLGSEPTMIASGDPSAEPSGETPPSDNEQPSDARVKELAFETVGYLRERDLGSLITLIDPDKGVRFSPYPYVNVDTDLVFKPDEFPTFKDTNKLKWGEADGSGDPIELTFRDYYEQFVYTKDFADAPQVNVNRIAGTGNALFNVPEVYPGASYVEFYFPGFDKELDGMDWQSLVLVFTPDEDDWRLAGIVHGQWTI
ncbi:hypothetical protein B1A99_17025 [Cohnella sp. CIP 111063]|nr:hypothetical protein B1A99_17025 [Cohnella sp. CIP 111063]PRX71147.1 hypothetical protein B0G52_110232 [Cohnella sp. SGD-V74]